MYKKRKFIPGECMHIYQREVKGYNIFYDLEDFLVFYMIFSTTARHYGVKVMMMCIMPNHVHSLLSSDSLKNISNFIMRYTSLFVREYNRDLGRKGQLFHKSFGSAPKKGGKSIRSTIVYIGNNPVEKTLSSVAEEYKWNFLSYIKRKIDGVRMPVRYVSERLRYVFKVIDSTATRGSYLNYSHLRRLMDNLNEQERDSLTDYIVMTFFPFETDSLMGFYKCYEDMINAMHSTAGKEYDIKEQYYPETDKVYEYMTEVLRRDFGDKFSNQIRNVIMLPLENKFDLAKHLLRATSASIYQISRFLHMPVERRAAETPDSE